MRKYLYIVLFFAWILPLKIWAAGWTPTDAGFVLNFEPGDQFLLSVWIDLNNNKVEDAGEEFFVCDYPSYNGGRFGYKAENYMKLVPQAAGATKPSEASVWTIREPIKRLIGKVNYNLGGICYTMWGNSGRTLYAAESPTKNSTFKFLGYLTDNENHGDLCDVAIVVPSDNTRTTNMDPNNTLGRASETGKFNGRMGTGFLGMTYREVYLFDIPRQNTPIAYTNASLVTFNTSNSTKSWSAGSIKPGFAAYAFADTKHNPTTRTVFRIYPLNKPFVSAEGTYFFGWDVQDYTRYRQSNTLTDSTSARKIYTLDHFVPMKRVGSTQYYQTAGTKIPSNDSTYYYVGKNNTFYATNPFKEQRLGSSEDAKAVSAFKHISNLRVRQLKDKGDFRPSKNAYGYLAIDTTLAENNLGVTFEPAGYFFQTSSDVNVPMRQIDDSTWMSEEMWYIADKYMLLEGRVVLYTDSVFSSKDPGAEISGWSQWVKAPDIPVAGTGGSSVGLYGWPRVHTNRATPNGGIEFVEADATKYIHYHNNGHFGADIPNQYPENGKTEVAVQDHRLLGDYTFICWTDVADTTGLTEGDDYHKYYAGDLVDLSTIALVDGKRILHLYAQAKYNGSINLAISFMQGGKRYFLTHPGTAPRFARARTFEEWTDVYQGMSDEANSEPNYLSTYKMIANPVCELCAADEVVLDPHHETMHGSVDSLTFYEYWTPANDEFIGLYYTTPNTVIANNTWAGAFKSSGGWPTPANPCVASTKIYSTDYFTGMKTGEYTKNSRGDLAAYIKYNSTDNQFDGDVEGNATDFMISGVGVVDEHYIILPDTTNASTPWRDEITFDAHNEVQHEQVWSKLIGKQLLAQMKVGDDTIYFHPNRDKTFNTANELRLSNDYRLRHEFEFIPDQRAVVSEVAEANRVTMEETENAFCCNVYSGAATPIADDDIVDTLRVWLRPASTSKIKEYFGRWKKGEVDSILADGSRYRDILIKTKTYHYGSEETRLILKPEQDSYSFGALANQSQTLNFLLLKETSQALLDAAGTEVGRIIVSIDTIKSDWNLDAATATLKTPALNIFTTPTKSGTTVTLSTQAQNAAGAKNDTLTVTIASITIGSTTYTDVTAKVPLTQSSMQGDELVWSVIHPSNGKRYFIMAGSGGLIFREYNLRDNTLYRLNSTTALIKGAANAENSNNQYITPWKFTMPETNTIALKTELPGDVNKYIAYSGSAFTVGDAEVLLTYKMVQTYANENANYEEKVRLKYATDGWLVFDGSSIRLTANEEDGTIFYWGYLQKEYNLLNNGAYPSVESLAFSYNNGSAKAVQTRYKAFSEYSMLLDNKLTYLCRAEVTDISTLGSEPWGMSYTITKIDDSRFAANASGLGASTNSGTLITTITPASATSPTNIRYPAGTGPYVDIVDTLQVTLSTTRTDYRFTNWEGVSSIGDAHVKIPLIRKTYHEAGYDSIFCAMEKTEYNFAFPSSLREDVRTDSLKTFHFETVRLRGTNVLDVDGNLISSTESNRDTVTVSGGMDLNNPAYAEIRLVDEYGQIPDWCEIEGKTAKTITVRCKSNGVRAPRTAYLYFAYIVTINGDYRYVNFKLTVSQASLFQYANNQTLIHTSGASGDPIAADGRQQAHENKRILYYYNPKPYDEVDQNEELPVRERGYYGWWRWYREGKDQNKVDVGDTDIPDSVWVTKPRNVGKFNYPFRIIGDSVMLKKKDGTDSVKVLVTMGRYTVFHYPSRAYNNKKDPPAKNPMVKGPWNKDTVTYVVDISNYYDNLPLSMAHVNQIDTAVLDTMKQIIEPTLSLREVFELHPWTEMAEKMEHYKTSKDGPFTADKYMEDHELMAPIGNRLLLRTEQRYNYKNLEAKGHTESLLGYYMRDDNWSTAGWSDERKDTMIWCGGWDADCEWYTYKDGVYTKCNHPITEDDDFLNVPAKAGITAGNDADTVIYCLRSRSRKSMHAGTVGDPDPVDPEVGDNWFNICRYKIIYHDPRKYGPIEEKGTGSAAKALITNDDIEQNYEVLERLNFDYVKTGKDYHIYPHPLPWEDASYGYSYPVTSEIPNNRFHDEKDFPGPGEYALINKIPYSTYWRKFEQHGGAENGFMIYCDGMSSAGQVAALSLETQLCEGQKMYFSGYIGNVSNQTGKSNPNFTFSVQGWEHESKKWVDITSYMTGDIKPSDKWYQIFFPINQEGEYDKFRIRIYNVASDFDGNDFVIDDMCVFATKPPLIAYQANTRCVDDVRTDSINHVVLRVDYQGFVDHSFNSTNVYYTVQQNDTIFVPMMDGYLNERTVKGASASKPDTIFGFIPMPHQDYIPMDEDSIFTNIQDMVNKFENSYDTIENWIKNPAEEAVKGDRPVLFNKGYLYESLDGMARPVLYVVHKAKVAADNTYKVRMSVAEKGKEGDAAFQSAYRGLLSSKCAVTSDLKITNRMVLELNGEEVDENDIKDICANSTYDLAMGIKGSLFLDSVAPMDVKGSCINDWLLYGDTTAYSTTRYGYSYHDIKKVIKDILRSEDPTNANLKASNLAAVNRNVMQKMKTDHAISLTTSDHPYDILAHLVSNGFLTLYQANLTTTVAAGDSVQYMIFPIFGTGTSDMTEQGMEVCPTPILVKLKPDRGGAVPMIVGGIKRDSTEMLLPVEELVNARTANDHYSLHIDSILPNVAIHNVSLLSTDDPNFYEGLHLLNMEPDRIYSFGGDNSGYYKKGDDIIFRPASSNNYTMQPGYTYTFGIVMQGLTGSLDDASGCPIGTVPFTLGIVPDYLRWAPQSKDNNHWNDPNNWIGVDDHNDTIPFATRFAPIASTDVIIPAMTDGMPYPKLPVAGEMHHTDSIREVNFVYNTCDDIRFLPGAAIGQQQILNCDAVVVDMVVPKQKWTLRSSPFTGMLSGDLFMSEADLSGENRPWYVGSFDASGRSYKTGNATFWLSLYNNTTVHINAQAANDTITNTESADWSKVTNGLTLPLPPAQGWAVYVRTRDGLDAADMRLPKTDDIYYYYGTYGERLDNLYEDNLRALRASNASPNAAGKLAFYPGAAATSQNYTLTNAAASTSFVFGNPTMGYIDIWGFIADNGLEETFSYLDESGTYTPITKAVAKNDAAGSQDTITNLWRYLPPMHAIVVSKAPASNSLYITLNTNRIVTSPSQVETPLPTPSPAPKLSNRQLTKGIMTVTAINPVSDRCVSRLLIGQGYNEAIISGEDAILTTVNIDKFHMTNTPTTPFNIYAMEGAYGLSIDLRDSIVNVPLSFYLTRQSNLPFDPVTHLWFTGVNSINGPLVLYDALTDTERPIIDGICLNIETPEINHEKRYYIRRPGFNPGEPTDPIATGFGQTESNGAQVMKVIRDGIVYILRAGHVYTIYGQQIR